MTTRAQVIAEARAWLGTRWQHQQATKGVGCDCIGLVRGVGVGLGLLPANFEQLPSVTPYRGYGRLPDGVKLARGLGEHFVPVVGPHRPGDILLLRFERLPTHVGIATEAGIVHAWAMRRRVVEHLIDATWSARIVCAYTFPGLED